jgi:hypothetical protein
MIGGNHHHHKRPGKMCGGTFVMLAKAVINERFD